MDRIDKPNKPGSFEKHIRKIDTLKSTPRLEILTVTIETDRHTLIIEGGLN